LTQILLFLSLLFFIGCGENNSRNSTNPEPYYYQQWYLEKNETFYAQNHIHAEANIHADNLSNIYSGKNVKIAVIDDGLDVSHEDLEGAIIHTFDSQTKSTNVSQTNQADSHGTAVTGIIGARVNNKGIKGVASSSEIILLKYKESMSDSETIELFSKAEEFGADIINCSWGTYDVSDAVKAKIQDLSIHGRNGKGVVVVFASGNDDQDMGNDESTIPEVIAVGATEKDNLRAWYSNYGSNLDVVAPGGYDIGITTLDSMGSDGAATLDENYILYNDANSFIGTSASAPIVSGVIALMLEKNPDLTRIQIDNILKSTGDKIGTLSYDRDERNDYYGYGKINLAKIMGSIQ
jgi:subtilisin family serine protease